MMIQRGLSQLHEAHEAVAQATAAWTDTPDVIFAFCSTQQDADAVAKCIRAKYPDTPMAGCTTSGEYLQGEHHNGSLVMAGPTRSGIRWATAEIEGLSSFNAERAGALAAQLFRTLQVDSQTMDPKRLFGMLMIDGMSCKEENVAALLADALEGVALAGGSAGDDLAFKQTKVMSGGRAWSDGAVVVMGLLETAQMEIIKHQHFVTTPRSLVITSADPATRTVHEIDGYPAIEAYAAALGLRPQDLNGDVTFMNPTTFSCNGDLYVRSIQQLNANGSITFYCAVEEGMVLRIGSHEDMTGSLHQHLALLKQKDGRADFVIGFNCILRSLEAKKTEAYAPVADVMQGFCDSMIGFDTYGEQLNGLHINQTLVALAFHHAATVQQQGVHS